MKANTKILFGIFWMVTAAVAWIISIWCSGSAGGGIFASVIAIVAFLTPILGLIFAIVGFVQSCKDKDS